MQSIVRLLRGSLGGVIHYVLENRFLLIKSMQAGVTHCFVNLGSDHPSIIEAIVKGQNEKSGQFPR